MVKEKLKFPYRQFVLQKNKSGEILHICNNYAYNDERLKEKPPKKEDEVDREIIDFFIIKGLHENTTQKMTYTMMVLYKSGRLRVFREMRIITENFENNVLYKKMMFSSK